LYALIRFLEINGYTIFGVTNDELYQFTIDAANSVLTKDDITAWLKSNAAPLEQTN